MMIHIQSMATQFHRNNPMNNLCLGKPRRKSLLSFLLLQLDSLDIMDEPPPKSGWLERLGALLIRKPEDREQLITVLHSAFERNLLDSDALSMIEGVMQVSEMQARDIMVPRSQMDIVDISETPENSFRL